MTARLRHHEMCGSDKRMDQQGNFDLPVNPLPVKCLRCTFPDLDFIPQPYYLAKGITKPTEMEPAELGNFFVRERTRTILETVVPGQCQFFPTHDLKSKTVTPWFLAVPTTLIQTATVKESVPRCPDCGEPKVAHPGSHYENFDPKSRGLKTPVTTQDIFKSLNWWSYEQTGEVAKWYFMHILGWKEKKPVPAYQWTRIMLGRGFYFSIRLEMLLKSLGSKGLYPVGGYTEKPDDEDREWFEDKRALLTEAGLAVKPSSQPSVNLNRWFRSYLKQNAAKKPVEPDFARVEKEQGIELPPSYKEFIATIGEKTYTDVDEDEGFTVHVLSPEKLDFGSYRKGTLEVTDEESKEIDGLMFAITDHGDCYCFDLSAPPPDYPVYLYDHELNAFEAYSRNFKEFIQRCQP